MAIGSITPTMTAANVARAPTADGATARLRQGVQADSGSTRNNVAATTGDANAATRKDVHAAQDARNNGPISNASPQIQFKDSEGTRVMEVFDSKNILIYQVPPKGLVMLIHSQDKQRATQLETTA